MMEDYGFNKGGYHYPCAAGFGQNGLTSGQHQKFLGSPGELRKEMHHKRFKSTIRVVIISGNKVLFLVSFLFIFRRIQKSEFK